jgi:hypothetical protein
VNQRDGTSGLLGGIRVCFYVLSREKGTDDNAEATDVPKRCSRRTKPYGRDEIKMQAASAVYIVCMCVWGGISFERPPIMSDLRWGTLPSTNSQCTNGGEGPS